MNGCWRQDKLSILHSFSNEFYTMKMLLIVVILFVPNGLINKSPLVEMKTLQQTIIWTKDGPSVMHVTCGPFN